MIINNNKNVGEEKMKEKVRVGVIGTGYVSQNNFIPVLPKMVIGLPA